MSDDFDDCDTRDMPTSAGETDAMPDVHGSMGSGRGPAHGTAPHGDGRGAAAWGTIFAVMSLCAALVVLVHAVAPAALPAPVGDQALMVGMGVMALVAIVLGVVARRAARGLHGRRRHRGATAVILVIFAVLILVLGVLVGRAVPGGVIKPPVRDEAPASSVQGMKAGVERAAGQCSGGWHDIEVSGYPGVEAASYCKDTRTAFVTFDSEASASMDRGLVKSAITQQLEGHADDARAKGDWRMLYAGRWMAVGDRQAMTALKGLWGGSQETVW